MGKRVIALILTFAIFVSNLPVTALAETLENAMQESTEPTEIRESMSWDIEFETEAALEEEPTETSEPETEPAAVPEETQDTQPPEATETEPEDTEPVTEPEAPAEEITEAPTEETAETEPEELLAAASNAADFTYTVLNGTFCEITGYTGTDTEVVIPQGLDGYVVQRIGDNAFKGNVTLERVVFPVTIETMGQNAFQGCKALTDVSLNGGLTEVSSYAFSGCTALERVVLPGSVKRIGSYAFSGCSMLAEAALPDGLTTIYGYAFQDCVSLLSIDLPDSVTTMSGRAFYRCTELAEVSYPTGWTTTLTYDNNDNYVDGYYEYTSPFEGCTSLKQMVIPAEGVESIPKYAFRNLAGLEQVTLPQYLSGIGAYAFDGCSGLQSITLPETLRNIDAYALSRCTGLEAIDLPEELNLLGDGVFSGCTGLQSITIPDFILRINSNVFSGCTGLTEVNLPEDLLAIYSYAFRDCTGLTSLHIPDTVTTMSARAFYNCTNLTEVNFPAGWTAVLTYDNDNSYDGYYEYTSPFEGCTALKKITVPEGVTAIPKHACRKLTGLQEIELPESLESISAYSFDGCSGLRSIALLESLTDIGVSAFAGCTDLQSIDIPEGITRISMYAFSGCTGLTEVVLPETLTTIHSYAFRDCTGLTSLHIPDAVATMSARAFYNCTNLTEVNFPAGWTAVLTYDNDNSYDGYYAYTSPFEGCTALKKITVPESVTAIPKHAFRKLAGLQEIELPESLESISAYSFDGCSGLRSIALPESLTDIGVGAFTDCTGLRSITIPEGITRISTYAFSGCTALTEVNLPESLNTIYSYAFRDCDSLEAVDIPDSVTTMSARAFYNCSKLAQVGYPTGWTTVLTYDNDNSYDGYFSPFEGCTALKKIEIDEGVVSLPKHAFRRQTSLSEVILPKSLTAIGAYAFDGCTGLEKIWIDQSVTNFGTSAFAGCTALTIHGVEGSYAETYAGNNSIPFSTEPLVYPATTISGQVLDGEGRGVPGVSVTLYDMTWGQQQEIVLTDDAGAWSSDEAVIGHTYRIWFYHVDYDLGEYADEYTIGEAPVTVPDVTAVPKEELPKPSAGDFTYEALNGSYCKITGYTGTETAVRLPAELDGYIVQSIGDNAFKGNKNLTRVVFPETVETMGNNVFQGCTALTDVSFNNGLTNVGNYAFSGCTALEKIILPSSVKTIGTYAFDGCAGLKTPDLPEGLNTIQSYAFRNCTGLERVKLPDSVKTMSARAFYNCTNLAEVNFPAGWTKVLTYDGNNDNYTDGSYNYTSPFEGCTALKKIVVPEGVTAIPKHAFRKMTSLEEIVLPDSLERVGAYAFEGCTGLASVSLPQGLTAIEANAFAGCTGLRSITIPEGVTLISGYAFSGCAGLTEVILPETLTTIHSYAFQNCTGLTGIHIPDAVTTMSAKAFYNCTNLTEVNFPAGWNKVLTYDGNNDNYTDGSYNYTSPFEGCTALKKIVVPEGVTDIPKHALRRLSSLEEVTLPESLESIGAYSFDGCSGLRSIELPESLTAIGVGAFVGCTGLRSITVPAGVTQLNGYAFSGCTGLTEVLLPETLTTIHAYAFQSCDSLEAVDIPDSVTTMSAKAFYNCTKLAQVGYPAGWTKVLTYDGNNSNYTDGSYNYTSPFDGCTALKKIEIDEGVVSLPKHAFRRQTSLSEVILPKCLTAIGAYAFDGCTGLEKIWIDQSVTSFGASAFAGCTALTIHGVENSYAQTYARNNGIPFSTEPLVYPSVTISGLVQDGEGKGVPGIFVTLYDLTLDQQQGIFVTDENGLWSDEHAIIGHTYRIWIYHVDYDIGEYTGEYTIGEDPVEVTAVTVTAKTELPETSVSDFTYEALNGTYCKITGYTGTASAVKIPSGFDGYIVQSVGDAAFKDNKTLTRVVFPETVETMGNNVFQGCTALADVSFNNGLTMVGNYAFSGCTALEKITLPSSVRSVGAYAFDGCTVLKDVQLPEGLMTILSYAFRNCTGLTAVQLSDSVKTMSARAFYNCTNLAEVNFPAGWTTTLTYDNSDGRIDGYYEYTSPFEGCTALKKIVVPEGVTDIPKHAFRSLNSLEEVILPSTLTEIGAYAFDGCIGLKAVSLPESLTKLGNHAFSGCTCLESVTVPAGVTLISGYAFSGCTGLTEVILPETLTTIHSYAFQNCTGLTSLHIPDAVTTMSARAFYNCTSLTEVNFPLSWTAVLTYDNSDGRIDGYYEYTSPFEGCTALRGLVVPEGVTAIPKHAYRKCTSINTLVLPSTLEKVGCYAFDDCIGLRSINMNDNLTLIEDRAFSGCDGLVNLTLGDGVETIGASAFADCINLKNVVLPSVLTTIRDSAFSGCVKLGDLVVPDSVTDIGVDAFKGDSRLVFYCSLYSNAAMYAMENRIPIIDTEEQGNAETILLDRQNSYYKLNIEGAPASGQLAMVAKYAFKQNAAASDVKLVFYIPYNAELMEKTLTVDGSVCTDYTYENGDLTIPVSNSEGIVRFTLKPIGYDKLTAYGKVTFDYENETRSEVLGAVYSDIPMLSINAKRETSASSVKVTGVTLPNKQVVLSVNGTEQITVQSNRAGDYTATVQLGVLSSGRRYKITAQCEGITAETTVIYRETAPTLIDFVMEHNGVSYDLGKISGLKPVVTFRGGVPFKFTVRFDKTSGIESLYMVSTRNNVRKVMEARWDEALKAYVAEGFFDENNKGYVPGVISVEYVHKGEKISFEDGYDFTSEEALNELPDEWRDASVTVKEDSETKKDVVIETSSDVSVRVITEKKDIPAGLTPGNAASMGYQQLTDDYGKHVYVRTYENPGAYQWDIVDFAAGQLISYGIQECLLDGNPIYDLVELAGACGTAINYAYEYSLMRNDILNSPNLTAAEKQAALHRLETAMNINAAVLVGKYAVMTAGLIIGAPASLGVTVGLVLLDEALSILRDMTMNDMRMMMFDIQEFRFTFRWAVDPSGYVYDAETEERIGGATVTVYWVPFDESDPGYWDKKPDTGEYGEVWDAAEYSQLNPLTTDADGRYAWDVPEGWWRVKCEKKGYETTWSDWVPVPPPQTEVHIAMTPAPVENAPVYRLYNAFTMEHLFVSSESEYELLGSAGWVQEGVAWNAPLEGAPVYRLYNAYTDGHFYTVSEGEKDKCIADGWIFDGVVSYSAAPDEGAPIYRMFNPFEEKNYHHYTASESERDVLVDAGWVFEGVAWYATNS